ncbi:MAG TPA: cupin domain-containing protein [Acetobacteraceae bacterium]|nr:cupin domain-containing protein [Acetobacteraceae bacterium]
MRKPDNVPPVGLRIRAFRKLQRLRLVDLAKRAGCSESLLSRIETGSVTPSLSTLHRLSQALQVNVALLLEAAPDHPCTVYPPGSRPQSLHSSLAEGDGSSAESLVPYAPERRLEALIVTLPEGGDLCGPFSHEGEEVGLVLEGTLELIVAGERHVLSEGSSFFFGSEHEHSYRAAAGPCRVVWINTPPTF